MRWYQWLALWCLIAFTLAPFAGAWVARSAEHYPEGDDDDDSR
jgi:hypothetical protein